MTRKAWDDLMEALSLRREQWEAILVCTAFFGVGAVVAGLVLAVIIASSW